MIYRKVAEEVTAEFWEFRDKRKRVSVFPGYGLDSIHKTVPLFSVILIYIIQKRLNAPCSSVYIKSSPWEPVEAWGQTTLGNVAVNVAALSFSKGKLATLWEIFCSHMYRTKSGNTNSTMFIGARVNPRRYLNIII